ncbi:lysine decarboxylase [Macrococcus bovicus]|uniref:Orn/Lys/Arg family decarboxylase n=1 Tax=Macrococcus bovicus TaxID=69968 RepID=UPI0025A5A900|nr:lysine decarboxylase [Macrococcus bovicus]
MDITQRLFTYSDAISLHVPGHHRYSIGSLQLPISHDMTEISGLDDYHHAEEVIADSQRRLARADEYEARYLVNGTTVGILSVIHAYKKKSHKKVAMMRNAHKSVFNALDLTGTEAIILPMTVSEKTQQYIGIGKLNPNAKWDEIGLAVLTYPNYFGETFDIRSAIDFFHQKGIEVLVDEAHGAHFDISPQFPSSSLNYQADYVVQSYHKTLPALTMGSVIHINHKSSLRREIDHYLSVLQTSSPSYLILSSLEQAHAFYRHYHDGVFHHKRQSLLHALRHFEVIEVQDPLKIMLRKTGYSGAELKQLLEQQEIYVELSNYDSVLLVLPLWHEGDTYPFDELLLRLKRLQLEKRQPLNASQPLNVDEGFYSPVNEHYQTVTLAEGIGYRLYHALIPYPPGIPYVWPGEKLTEAHVKVLSSYQNVHGIIDGKITIIDER